MEFSIHFGEWKIPGGQENFKARQAVFFTPLNPFGDDPDEEKPHGDHIVLQKVHSNLLDTQSRCSFFGSKNVQSAGTGIAILTNKIFCNHHLRQETALIV